MNLLSHVAIIMDGNGRWGLKKKKSRKFGHLQGLQTIEKIIDKTLILRIPYLTLYTFSTENWKRPKSEISFLFMQLEKYFKKNLEKLIERNIKILVIGEKKGLSKRVKKIIFEAESKTKKNKKLSVIIALNYGSRQEIIFAIKRIIRRKKKININNFKKELYTFNIPDPDILIRTGARRRLSNFMLWQSAYTEFFFSKKMWPDFNTNDYYKIIKKFYNIKRNYGGV